MIKPESTLNLLDRAEAAHHTELAERELSANEQDQQSRNDQFDTGLRLLGRLVPSILGVPFDRDRATLRQLHATGFTAQIEVDGYMFAPKTSQPTLAGSISLSESKVTALEVRIKAAKGMMRHSDIAWVPITSLADLGAAIEDERAGSWGTVPPHKRH